MKPTRVLYDISVLGQGHYDSRARTGIYRVIEELARGLARSPEVDLRFCASRGNLFQCGEYLKTHPEFSNCQFGMSAMQRLIAGLDSLIRQMTLRIDAGGSFFKKISLMLGRRFTKLASAVLKAIVPAISSSELSGADIYHSLYFPIPRGFRRYNNLRLFQTVYDLIPILFPEYVDASQKSVICEVMKSLDEKTSVLCISESTKKDLCAHMRAVDPEKVFVTHLAASDNFYQCDDKVKIDSVRQKYSIPAAKYILGLSTMEPRKNIALTIRAFTRLIKENGIDDLILVLAGVKGWKYDEIIRELSVSDEARRKIIVTGFVPDEDLAPLYSGALMFAYPSFYEGFGLPPLEAMQCGVPVVTSNTSSLPEVVGDAGIMIDPHDEEALCRAMERIYRNPALREDLSKKSIARARMFRWDRCVAQTIEAYKKSLST